MKILQFRFFFSCICREQQEKNVLTTKYETITTELNDLTLEMDILKKKESENLSFTSKLTEKNTKLQSENSILSEKVNFKRLFSSISTFIFLFELFKLQNLITELNDLKKLVSKSDEKNKSMVIGYFLFLFIFLFKLNILRLVH